MLTGTWVTEMSVPPDQGSSGEPPFGLAPNNYSFFMGPLAIKKQTTTDDFFSS